MVIEWEHPFAVVHDAPEHDPPASIATLVPSAGAEDPLLVARVAAVHRRLAAAAVPHVLPILGVERKGERLCIVHRRVEAESLAAVLRRGPLPLPRTLTILRRLCAALGAAQRLGVDHRALGPATVLLGPHDELWIADFGIADLLARDRGAELDLVPITPEQISGGATATSEDVYLLGCLAYWMVAGQPVFRAADLATLRRRHAIEDPPPLATASAPVALREAIARALEKEPDDRCTGFDAFDALLAKAQREAGLADSEAPLPQSVPAFVPRRQRIHPGVWTCVGALAVGLWIAVSTSSEAQPDLGTAPPVVITASVVPVAELPPVPGPVPQAIAIAPTSIAISTAPAEPLDADEIVVEDEARVRGRVHDAATPRCEAIRREAAEAREAHDWRSLLRATAQKGCWRSHRAPHKLRIKALLELKEFDACAAAAARGDAGDPELARWGELCRRRTVTGHHDAGVITRSIQRVIGNIAR